MSKAIPRTQRPSQTENAEEILEERVGDAFNEATDEPHNKQEGDDEEGWVVEDNICTDGGTVLGFFDTFHPQPWDNSQRLYYVDDPHITRPLVRHDEPTVGFYALNGESMVSFPENQEKEQICAVSNGPRAESGQADSARLRQLLVAHLSVHAQARASAWNRPHIPPGWIA